MTLLIKDNKIHLRIYLYNEWIRGRVISRALANYLRGVIKHRADL